MPTAISVFLLLSLPASSLGAVRHLDLRHDASTVIIGAANVAAAGDVNGDGIPDLFVSRGRVAEQPSRGRSWVIFGSRPMPKRIDLKDLGDSGFVIEGADERDFASVIASAGDVNGDGLDDIIVGAPGANRNDQLLGQSGRAYVVFGKKDVDPVHLSDFNDPVLSTGGFRIEGPLSRSFAGQSVAGLGDVNGDGLADVVVAAPFGGSVYVIFGKTDPLPIDLAIFDLDAQGPLGYRIDTPSVDINDLMSVAGAGDVNGDGIPDVIVGVIPTLESAGSAYVVFGKNNPLTMNVRDLGDGGFRIKGPRGGALTGKAVAGAGDINGDGLSDVIVGSPTYCCVKPAVHIVFGKEDSRPVKLARSSAGVIKIKSSSRTWTGIGRFVAGAGDVNGDGRGDVLISEPTLSVRSRVRAGAAYLVHGRKGTSTIELGQYQDGYRMDGARAYDFVGNSLAVVGDVDGDGVPDVLLGAPGREDVPRSFLVWGRR